MRKSRKGHAQPLGNDTDTRYALMVVDSMNLGDAIQAIASRQFLPRVDYYIERDNLGEIENLGIQPHQRLKMIMNGWYIDDGALFPPPALPGFTPLLISMHVNDLYANNYTEQAFLTDEAKKFFRKFGPVGARDTYSADFFNGNDMEAYFSGCMTLTLRREESLEQRDHILAVNLSDQAYATLVSRTSRPVIRMDVDVTQNLDNEEMLALGEYYLMMYQTAHLVVTTRLHATLPTIALGGNVLFIEESNLVNKDFEKRFAGLHTLVYHMTAKEFIDDTDNEKYDIENPPVISREYITLRDKLRNTCKEYTGYETSAGFLHGRSFAELVTSRSYMSAVTKVAGESALFYKAEHGWNVERIGLRPLVRSTAKKILNKKTW